MTPLGAAGPEKRPDRRCRPKASAGVAAAEREESRFFEIQNPRSIHAAGRRYAWNRRQLFRAPRFLSSTVHGALRQKKFRSVPFPADAENSTRSIPSSFPHKIFDFAGTPCNRKTGAPAAPRAVGRGGAKKCSEAQSSPLGGDGVGGVSSDDMGGALHQPSLTTNPPRPKGMSQPLWLHTVNCFSTHLLSSALSASLLRPIKRSNRLGYQPAVTSL